ncbi:MAG: GYD domain-containing protein [Alphaproteobacteria bacterium]|nr:GYD domain-containing protein [Alphaproteobacteria bacterium]
MPFYLFQGAYNNNQIKALVDTPSNRTQAGRELMESFGGKLHQWFMAFGEWDLVGIIEFPDNETAAAAIMRLASSNVFGRAQTTVLFTPEEAEHAMRRANTTPTSYRPPLG